MNYRVTVEIESNHSTPLDLGVYPTRREAWEVVARAAEGVAAMAGTAVAETWTDLPGALYVRSADCVHRVYRIEKVEIGAVEKVDIGEDDFLGDPPKSPTTFSLSLSTTNAAFEDDGMFEVRRILLEVADAILRGEITGVCRDLNGNNVGGWSW